LKNNEDQYEELRVIVCLKLILVLL